MRECDDPDTISEIIENRGLGLGLKTEHEVTLSKENPKSSSDYRSQTKRHDKRKNTHLRQQHTWMMRHI